MLRIRSSVLTVGFFLILFAAQLIHAEDTTKEYGVYQYVVTPARGTFDEISKALDQSANGSGWRVLAMVDAGVPKGCSYKSKVFVLFDSKYAQEMMAANRKTGPFAVVDRINLFQDENGIHVAVVNPHSIDRTILMDDQKYEKIAETHLQSLRQVITGAVQGTTGNKDYGQIREEGYIGKTMGVMAGGKFEDKIVDLFEVDGGNLPEVVAKVRDGLSKRGGKWGMHLVYEVELPEFQTVVFGSTGTPMDSRSFSIVKAGTDESRDDFKCPGLAHAAAYPIEVVVAKEGEVVKVRVVDSMFRMKMYFEDAGNWAFMTNMSMPGSIQDELKAQVKKTLRAKK
ncbi:hypothetical protein L0152_11100 [bacterium]|nr:hypothetical protein [bacterium]